MALVDLQRIKAIFSGERSQQEKQEAFKEMLIMVLSRATDADMYTDPVEVESVIKVVKEYLDLDISGADVRVAAASELYERAPLSKYLTKIGPQLEDKARCTIARALVDVLRADGHVRNQEVDYFNMVSESLRLTPAEIAGLAES